MKKKIFINIIVYLAVVFLVLIETTFVFSQTTYYSNKANGSWENSGDWSPPGVPRSGSIAIIQNGHTYTMAEITAGTCEIQPGGTLNVSSGTNIFNGPVTVSGTLNLSGSGTTIRFNSDLTVNSGGSLNNSGSTTVYHNGTSKIMGSGSITFFNYETVNVSTAKITNEFTNPININGTFKIRNNSTFTQGSNSHIKINNTITIESSATLNFSSNPNTVEYSYSTAGKSIYSTSYYNLKISGTAPPTFPSTLTLFGNLIIDYNNLDAGTGTIIFNGTSELQGTASTVNLNNITINTGKSLTLFGSSKTLRIKGHIDNSGTINHNSGTVTFNGTSEIKGSSTTTFNNIVINSGKTLLGKSNGTFNVDGNFQNNGTFTHQDGTVNFTGTSTISGDQTTTFKNLTITGTLTAPSGNINIQGDFTDNGTFTHNNGTVIFDGGGTSQIKGSSTTVFNNLIVSSGSTVEATPGKRLTVNGTLNVESGNFRLKDDGSNLTASLLANNISTGGNFESEIYFPVDRWFYVASPVVSATASSFDPSNSNVGLFSYNTAANVYTQITDDGLGLEPMQGYAIKYKPAYGAKTVIFSGTNFYNGDVAFSATGGGSGKGWNLAGNPYPSAIDWKSNEITRANIATYIYYRTNSTWALYDAATDESTNGGQRYIPAMQGIWIKATNSSGGTLTLKNGARLHNSQAFYKTAPFVTPQYPQVRLKLTNVNTSYYDETVFNFRNYDFPISDGLDDYDIEKMIATETGMPSIYSKLNNTNIAVNQLTPAALENNPVFDVAVNLTSTEADYTLVPSLFNIPADIDVYLVDIAANKQYNLRKTSAVRFSSGKAIDNNRFRLVFSKKTNPFNAVSLLKAQSEATANINQGYFNISDVAFSNNSFNATINNYTDNPAVSIEIVDLLGNVVYKENTYVSGTAVKKLQPEKEISSGVYFVKFVNGTNVQTSKFFISK